MNLELIQEINELKENKRSYTEIAEITGLARTSIVLSLRLSQIFHSSYSQKISLLTSAIELLKSAIEKYKDSNSQKEQEIKRLSSLTDIDYANDMLMKKSEFKRLENELGKYKSEVDILNRKLRYKEQYLKNLSFIDKVKILFS